MPLISPFAPNGKSLAYNCEVNILKVNLLLVAIKKHRADDKYLWPEWEVTNNDYSRSI